MSHLGFTFYPKDWWTSDTFYILSPFERYIYLELLFMMYDNEGSIINDKARIERRLCTTIKDDVWLKITDLMVKDGDRLTHTSVNKRLARIIASRENGKKGGAPKGNSNAKKQPKQPKKTTLNNPPLEIETKIESKSKIETKVNNKDIDKEKNIKKEKDVDLYVSLFNQIRGTRFKVNDKVSRQFNARLKEGYTVDQMIEALEQAMKEKHHKDTQFKYLVPEFFTRSDKIELYSNTSQNSNPDLPQLGVGEYIEDGKRYYGSRKYEVPWDMPPRPTDKHYFNPSLKQWNV